MSAAVPAAAPAAAPETAVAAPSAAASVPAAAANAAPAASAPGPAARPVEWSEEERAARRAAREARLAAVSALDEAVVPLYPGYPEVRVLVYNVAKKANVGTIVRTAVAFGATQIIVVGNRKINTMGNQMTNRFLSWKHFDKWGPCRAWIREQGFSLVGVEIAPRAKSVTSRPFSAKTVLMLGNEGSGISQQCMDDCDELVYIPQFGRGTASMNVATAAAVVLHEFAQYANYPTHAPMEGHKFVVDVRLARQDAGKLLAQQEQQGAAAAAAAGGDASGAADGGEDGDDGGEES